MNAKATNKPTLSKPLVVSRLNVGDVLVLDKKRVEILTLTDDFQRSAGAPFKTASVRNVKTGEVSDMRLPANIRYQRLES